MRNARWRHLLDATLILGLCIVSARLACAQAPQPGQETREASGVLAGTVTGPDDARLPGVTVVIEDLDRDREQRVVSNERGGYFVPNLRPGRYAVRAELAGFQSTEPVIVQIAAGETTTWDGGLVVAAVRETVTVIGTSPRDSYEATNVVESGARDIAEALVDVAGVWKLRKAAIANDIVLRGYQGDNVSVLIDGMRLYGACPGHMDRTAFHVDFAEVDRVEIAKGPFDLRNQGSLGGAVNIVTKRPGQGFHLTPNLSFGSYGYVNPSVTAAFGTPRMAVLGGYSYRASDPYTDGRGQSMLAVNNFLPGAFSQKAFEINTGWGRFDLTTGEGQTVQISFTRQHAGSILYPYMKMDAVYDNAERLNVEYNSARAPGRLQGIRAQGYFSRVRHMMTDEFRTSSVNAGRAYSMGSLAGTETEGGKLEALWAGGLAGFEFYRRNWGTESWTAMGKYQPTYSMPDVWVTAAGMYAEHSLRSARGLTLDLGVRVDHASSVADSTKANTDLYFAYLNTRATSAADTSPSAKARLTWQATTELTVSGGVGRAVRIPDPQERFYAATGMGSDWVGNPRLRPTGNTGLDLTLTYRRPRVHLNATFYRDRLDDFVTVYTQARANMPTSGMSSMSGMSMPSVTLSARSYGNVSATMSGAELEAVVSLTERLFLSGDISGVRGRQDSRPSTGILSSNIAEIPPARSRLTLRYDARQERGGLFAEVEGIYSSSQDRVNIDVMESATPGWAMANVRVGGTLGRARVTFGVANLFDRAYVEHLSYQRDPYRSGVRVFEPGRNMYGQLAFRF